MDGGFPRSVAIHGVGLIGGSLSLALKRRIPGVAVYGIDQPETLAHARQLGIIDPTPPPAAVDLIVLAAPVGQILQLIGEMRPQGALVLDVGSTKVRICEEAERRGLPFIGGHPMTGSERSGPDAASPDLFMDARFFLCPLKTTPEGAMERVEELVRAIGAIPAVVTPADHDRIVAQLSHLPQLLSTLLAHHTTENRDFAGPGWKSATRLAASPFHVWRDILATSGSLPQELRTFMEELRVALEALESGEVERIERVFDRANRLTAGGPQ